MNENHDDKGQFSSGGGGGRAGKAKASKIVDRGSAFSDEDDEDAKNTSYEAARDAAMEAQDKARTSHAKEDHRKAAELHRVAEDLAKDRDRKSMHYDARIRHETLARLATH